MADKVLRFPRQLSHRFSILRDIEDRIIAESAFSCWLIGDHSLAYAFGFVDFTITGDHGGYAAEASCALVPWDVAQLAQENLYPFRIASQDIPSGVDSRRSPERIYLKSRVIGECKQSGGTGIGSSLLAGVLGIGRPVLTNLKVHVQVVWEANLGFQWFKKLSVLSLLTRIMRGDEEFSSPRFLTLLWHVLQIIRCSM
jgi:hypothetical protein